MPQLRGRDAQVRAYLSRAGVRFELAMRIIANENVGGPVVETLRERGHDVVWVKETMRGARDEEVLARAQSDQRLVVTLDKDFGELAFRIGLPAACGIVLFRLSGQTPETDNARVVAALESRSDWAGHFATVTDTRVRIRPLSLRGAPTQQDDSAEQSD